jgi:hypothetical protein
VVQIYKQYRTKNTESFLHEVIYKGKPIKIRADFLEETLKDRKA